VQQFVAGDMVYVAAHCAFQNPQNQSFFITDRNRIMRYDGNASQYNLYDPKMREFLPCDGLEEGEKIQELDATALRKELIAQESWGDYLLDKGSKFTFGAGRSLAYSAGAGVAAGLVGPVAKKALGHAGKVVAKVAEPVVKKAPPMPSMPAIPGVKTTSAALHSHLPPGAMPVIAGVDGKGCVRIDVPVDPLRFPRPVPPPFLPFHIKPEQVKDAAINGGIPAVAAGVGAAIGGPVGGAVAGAVAAGIGALF
jgi:hypothetical protein